MSYTNATVMEIWKLYVGLSFLFFTCVHIASCDQQGEQANNAAELNIYRVSVSDWSSGENMEKLASRVVSAANSYCASSPKTCGMTSCCINAFTDADIGTAVGYPIADQNGKDLVLRVYIDLPANSNLDPSYDLSFVVKQDVTAVIIGLARDDIFTDTGYYITFIGDTFYGIAPASLENQIIIPLAFGVVLSVVMVAVVLHFWNKRRETQERRRKLFEKRKKTKVVPVHNIENEEKPTIRPPKRNNNANLESEVSKHSEGYKTKPIDTESQKNKNQNRFVVDESLFNTVQETGVAEHVVTVIKPPKSPVHSDDSFKEVHKSKKKKKDKHRKRKREGYANMNKEDEHVGRLFMTESPGTVNTEV